MKAWMGFGISKYYMDFSEELSNKINNLDFENYIFLIADEMQRKYNGTSNEDIAEHIRMNLLRIPDSEIIMSSQLEMKIPLTHVQKKYEEKTSFYNEVNGLVIKNRAVVRHEDLRQLAGYVLEEIALTIYFYEKGYVKIGPEEKERPFDLLSQKYFNISKENFQYI
jgi:hypothetical protein